MKFIQKILGTNDLLFEIKKQNKLLEDIKCETKRNADLQERYNNAYHIK